MKHVTKLGLASLILIVGFVVFRNIYINDAQHAGAETVTCPNGTIMIDGNAHDGSAGPTPLNPGQHQLGLYISGGMPASVTAVHYFLDNPTTYIGRGLSGSSSNYPYWPMTWYSQVSPNGNHAVGATLVMSGGSCNMQQLIPVAIQNPTVSPIGVIANPNKFNGYTNQPLDFLLTSKVASGSGTASPIDITPWAMFRKGPVTIGAITSPIDFTNAFKYYSGPNAGQGNIRITAMYGGVSAGIDIPSSVVAQNTTTSTSTSSGTTTTNTSQSSTSTTPDSSTTTTTTTSTQTTTAPASNPPSVPSTSPARSCIIEKITQVRFDAINSGSSRPTPAEFEAMKQCFAAQSGQVPANFATVPPVKATIQQKPVSEATTIANAATTSVKKEDAKVTVLKFSGKAEPNTTVLLYLFSEPIVLSTTSDKNGDWSYSLEDPLEPGKHEAYALVDRGSGKYERSSVFSFAIAKASAAESNPNGYSLKLERTVATASENDSSTRKYILGVGALILTVLLGFSGYLLNRGRRKTAAAAPFEPIVAQAAPAQTVTPDAPVVVATPVATNPVPAPTPSPEAQQANPSTPATPPTDTPA